MGLAEVLGLGANVVIRLKADTSDAKAAIKELSGVEKKAAEERLKGIEAANKKLEQQAKTYQFAAQAIGGVTAAVGIGKAVLEAYAKTGGDAAEQVKRIQETGSKAFDSVMASVGKLVVQLEPLIAGFSGLVKSLSEIGVAGPLAIGALGLAITGNPAVAGAITLLGFAADGKTDASDYLWNPGKYAVKQLRDARARGDAQRASEADAVRRSTALGAQTLFGASASGLARTGGDSLGAKAKLVVIDKPNKTVTVEILDPDEFQTYGSRRRLGTGSGSTGQAAAYSNAGLDAWQAQQSRAFRAGSAGLMSPWAQQGDGIRAAQESQLSQMFGPLSDFNAYATAFDTLSGAIGSAMTAWIDGSMSAGKAFKAFIAEAVKGLAVQMTIEALKHGAYAIGSLAMGNFAGAAMHGKAAAGFAAGAVVAAAAAKGLASGGAASTGGGYSPSAPSTLGGSASSGQAQQSAIIVYGDSFAEDSPRQRQLQATRLVNRAMSGRSAVEAR